MRETIAVIQTETEVDFSSRVVHSAIQYNNWQRESNMPSIKFSVRGSTGLCKREPGDVILLFELNGELVGVDGAGLGPCRITCSFREKCPVTPSGILVGLEIGW